MHCLVEFCAQERAIPIDIDADKAWLILSLVCPACHRLNLFLVNAEDMKFGQMGNVIRFNNEIARIPIRPRGSRRPPCPAEVPPIIAKIYAEACLVLPDSEEASAALSRRCLQTLLRESAKVKPGNLADEIQQVIDGHRLPSDVEQAIDAIRNIGNFAAHPMKSQSTGEILPVEPGEAEWNLEVLEELFDHYYTKPARLAAKRAVLNAKLKDAGKPPMK